MRCLNCSREGLTTETQVCPGCGVYLPSLVRELLPPGTLLHGGKYRIDYALGRGGFGVTYVARHVSLEQPVAVKEFFPRDFAVRDSTTGRVSVGRSHEEPFRRSLKRFVREGQTLALVSHPSVVRVRDQFEEMDTAYLVMDLISPARTLREELDAQAGRRLPPERAETITGELVEALEAVHRAGVYHLDIKPDNILLTPAGRPVLVDFGAARRGLSSQSTQAFTLEYAAPEVLAGEDVGPESDLFELGMVVHEMLTGERPPSAMARLMRSEWEPVALEAPWAGMVSSAIRMRKEERPKSVAEWWRQGLAAAKAKSPRQRKPKSQPTTSEEQKPATAKGTEQQPSTAPQQKLETAPKRQRSPKRTGEPVAGQSATDTQDQTRAKTTQASKAPDASVVARLEQLLREGKRLSALEFYASAMGAGLKESKDFVEELEKRLRLYAPSEPPPAKPPPPKMDDTALLTGPPPSPPIIAPVHPPAKASSGRGVGWLLAIVVAGVVIYNVYPRMTQNGAASRNNSARATPSGSQVGLPVPTPDASRPSQSANYAAAPHGAAFATKYCAASNAVVRHTPNISEMAFAVCGCGVKAGVIGVTETLDNNTGRVLYHWAEIRYTDPSGRSIEGWVLSTSLADSNPC